MHSLDTPKSPESTFSLRSVDLFDPPYPTPPPDADYKLFPDAYIHGPIPDKLKRANATDLLMIVGRLNENKAAALVDFGSLWLDDRPCLEPEHKLALHSYFRINPPAYGPVKFYEADPKRIIFEDDDLLIYNKESGRPSQAVPYDAHNNTLAAIGRLLTARGKSSKVWLSHRLDADTSGLLVMTKNKKAASFMGQAFQKNLVEKAYLALGLGDVPEKESFTVDAPISKEKGHYVLKTNGVGLKSRTDFKLLDCQKDKFWQKALFMAVPLSGRTHQIRLHLAWAGWPIIGDRFYGRPDEENKAERLMLNSYRLAFPHPISRERMNICLPALQNINLV